MKHKAPVFTLALLGALALAALSGGLLPADSAVHAQADDNILQPTLYRDIGPWSVFENTPPGVNIGNPVSATDRDEDGEDEDDLEFGDTLTYSLEGTDATSFNLELL